MARAGGSMGQDRAGSKASRVIGAARPLVGRWAATAKCSGSRLFGRRFGGRLRRSEQGFEGLTPVAGRLMGEVFFNVGEHAFGGTAFIAAAEQIHFHLPLEFGDRFVEEFFVGG